MTGMSGRTAEGLPEVAVRTAALSEILQLRHDLLRPGMPLEASRQPQDLLPETWHCAAFVEEVAVSCASVSRSDFEGKPAWRLRGMATDPEWQGRGCGALLLREVCRRVFERGDDVLWCNARTSALGFYEKCSFVTVGGEFVTELGIPHYVAVWRVQP